MHFVVTFNDEASVDVARFVTYGERCGAAINFFFKVREGCIITCAPKSRNSLAINTVPVAVLPCTFIQSTVFLVRRMKRR